MPELPEPLPPFKAAPAQIAEWASKATRHDIAATWRPGHSENAALLVRLANGQEILFETIGDACRPDRFISAFLAVDGVSMPEYSKPQMRIIVGALIRMAAISEELDERDFWADTGSTFLRACLTRGNIETITLEEDSDAARRARYSAAIKYAKHLGELYEDQLPRVLVAVDSEMMLIPRSHYLLFVGRRRRGIAWSTVNTHMRRLGWDRYELQPRKPKAAPGYPRPHVRMWKVPNGWDGVHVEIKNGEVVAVDFGALEPHGSSEARAGARTPPEADPRGSAAPSSQDRETGS
jgi:hypothetical protein